jgi:UDP-N-acetylglucosamine:LPS N-acetylglucosamine transferase
MRSRRAGQRGRLHRRHGGRVREADLVICRAGAITVSELTAAGVASVLVPFVASTTSHQRDNAVWMAQQKAAIHLPQGELNPQQLAQAAANDDRDACLTMAEAAQASASATPMTRSRTYSNNWRRKNKT